MADSRVLIEIITTSKGLKIAAVDAAKLAKETEKIDKSQDKATKSGNKFHKLQKGVAQAGANSTKNFSKMNQTMGSGGSSGLVAAYATLAANVFAATAAFAALSRAAEFENLQTGLLELGATSGQTLSVVADGLREITGMALSSEEAMRGAALGISGGFGGAELEGLAKIAKGASITLGRNLPDAFDRLTRGAIKLEPEILDELGIMVRVDDAMRDYAVQLGKASTALTQMEKRQAFMNAILEQGEMKFGHIADSVETDVYAKLGATFSDLTKHIFTFVNESLRLGTVVGFLAENMTVLAGVMILFGSTIASKMLPFLANAGEGAARTAKNLRGLADSAAGSLKSTKDAIAASIMDADVGSKAFKKTMADYAAGNAGVKELTVAKSKLAAGERQLHKRRVFNSAKEKADHEARIIAYQQEQIELGKLIAMEDAHGSAAIKADAASIIADQAQANSRAIAVYTQGGASLGQTLGSLKDGYGDLSDKLIENAKGMEHGTALTKKLRIGNAKLKAGMTQLGAGAKAIGAAFMSWLPLIGAIVIVAGVLYAIWNKLYNTKEHKAYVKQQEKLNEVLENQAKIADTYHKTNETIRRSAEQQVQNFEQISNSIKQVNKELKETIRLRELSSKDYSMGLSESQAKIRAEGFDTEYVFSGRQSTLHTLKPEEVGAKMDTLIGENAVDLTKEQLAQIFQVQDSDEWKTFQNALKSEIPMIAESAARKFDNIMSEGFENPKELVLALAGGMQDMEDAMGGLGTAVRGMHTGLVEAEKEAAKFMQSFAKTTKVDRLSDSLDTIVLSLADIDKEAKLAGLIPAEGAEALLETGKALSSMGDTTARMIGPKFVTQLDKVRDLEDKIWKIRTSDMSQRAKKKAIAEITPELEEQLKILGDYDEHVRIAADRATKLQRTLLTTAQELKNISTTQKTINGLQKSGINMQKHTNTLTKKKFELEKRVQQAQRGFLVDNIEATRAARDIDLGFMDLKKGQQVDIATFEKLSVEEQVRLATELGLKKADVYSLEQLNFQIKMKNLQSEHSETIAVHQATIQVFETLKKKHELEKKAHKTQQEIFKLQRKIANFESGRGFVETGVEEARAKIDAAKYELDVAILRQSAEKKMIAAKARIQEAELVLLQGQLELAGMPPMSAEDVKLIQGAIKDAETLSTSAVDDNIKLLKLKYTGALLESFETAIQQSVEGDNLNAYALALAAARDPGGVGGVTEEAKKREADAGRTGDDAQFTGEDGVVTFAEKISLMKVMTGKFTEEMSKLGPTGEAYANFMAGAYGMADGLTAIKENGLASAEGIKGVTDMIGGIGQMMQAASAARVAAIDNEIKAEENRDGKSKESLAKIQQLKQKKYQIEKKAFEQNKKIQLAGAIIDGLAAIQSGFATQPFFPMGMLMGGMATAMTMMQIKAIKSQTFSGEKPDMGAAAAPSTALSIGKRGSSVDLSRGATGGELGYLRGQRGYGTSASDWTPTGGGAGLRKGYGVGGILVGEQGPEVITPKREGYEVIPNDRLGGEAGNINFTINAVDAAGVEDVLLRQRGHIIGMIRQAANDTGERFLESVDTDVVGGG